MGRLGLLGTADFRSLWIGETISQFGSQVSVLALPYIATVVLKASPFEVSVAGALQFVPFLLFALPAGAWLDRMRRRPVLISGDLVRVVALGTIPVAWELGLLTIWQLYVVGFVCGIATVFFDVAYLSYLPALLERSELPEANGKLQASEAAASIVGPGMGGALIGLLGAPVAIVADAVSYLASALFVAVIRKPEPHPEAERAATGTAREPLHAQIVEGLAFVFRNPYLRAIAVAASISNFLFYVIFALAPVFFYRELGLDAATVGAIFGLGAIGGLVGALVASRVARAIGLGRTIIGGLALGGFPMVIVPLAPRDAAFPWLVGVIAVATFANLLFNINQVSFRQSITPSAIQGRMNASMRFLVWGTIPVGSVAGGLLATAIGVHDAILLGALAGCFAFLPLLFSPVRSLRSMPSEGDSEQLGYT